MILTVTVSSEKEMLDLHRILNIDIQHYNIKEYNNKLQIDKNIYPYIKSLILKIESMFCSNDYNDIDIIVNDYKTACYFIAVFGNSEIDKYKNFKTKLQLYFGIYL